MKGNSRKPRTDPSLPNPARREVLKGGLAIAGAAALGSFGLAQQGGGSLNIGVDEGPVGFDPNLVTSFSSFWPISAVYETLVELDATLSPRPGLAQSWEIQGDRTYVFHLRPGVTFHDGSPLKASDVVFTFNRVLDPKASSPGRSYISAIKQLEASDEHTVKITLESPYAPLLINLANYNLSIVSEAAVKSNGNLQRVMVGTGPFKLGQYVEGNSLQLVKNPKYWRNGQPYLQEVVL